MVVHVVADLRRIRQFAAVADAGSLTAAAAELHLSQQALSASVRRLEAELGVALLSRAGRRISLTPAGHALLTESRPLLAAADTVGQRVRAAGSRAREWVVGHSPALDGTEVYALLEPAIAAFPTMSFTLRQCYPDRLAAGVLDGTLNLGLRRGVATGGDLASALLGYHRVRAAVPAGHRLATAAAITLPDLADEPLALWAPPGASYFSDFLMAACRRCGFEPDFVVSRVQGAAMVTAPLSTGAVALVTAEPGPAVGGRVVVVELEPPLLLPVQALWQQHTACEVRAALLDHTPV